MKSTYILISFFCVCVVNLVKAQQKDTVYKFGDYLVEASDTTKIDFIVKNAPNNRRISKGDTIFENEKYIVLGDYNKTLILGVFKKYKLKYNFSQFPTIVYKGKLAVPNFKTDTAAYRFRTAIRSECKNKGVNFAGHYTIAMWGCGSDCQQIAIVDRFDGSIYFSNLPGFCEGISYGIGRRPDSRMLILNSGLLFGRHKGYVSSAPPIDVETIEWANNKARRLPE